MANKKLFRITTVPISLRVLLTGQLKFMSEHGFDVVGISSPEKALKEVELSEGIRTIPVEMTRSITPFQDLKALFRLIRWMRKEKPTLVHTHTPKAGLLGMMAARITGVPHRLHTVAGMPLTVASGVKRKLLNLMERLTYACATQVYPNSFGLKDLILEYGFTKESKLKVIGNGSSNGIDTSEFDPDLVSQEKRRQIRKNLNIPENDFVFLFVGRVVGDKGINELVDAFSTLFKQLNSTSDTSNPHLVLVGNRESHLDPLLPETERIIAEHPNIHAVGYKKDVINYFAMADVLTFPSYREGFPNVVMQAAAMQLNCIVSDINGCNEIITNGANGWIVPVKNSEKLQECMVWCFNNQETSKKMGIANRKIIKENYERSFVHQELLREYERLLHRKN